MPPARSVRSSRQELVNGILQDSRYGARTLAKHPGFTAAAVLALALGIGANADVFSVTDAVLLRPLPYEDADRLVVILHRGHDPVAPGNFLDWRRETRVFSRMGAAEYWTPNLSGVGRPEKVWALRITSNVFPLLGVRPLLGRVFLPQEDQPGQERGIVLSYTLWQRRFGGDVHVVGRQITLDGEVYTVIGVMPRGFRFAPFWATKAEAWAPLVLASRATDRGGGSLRVFARLKPGVTLDQARADMAAVTSRLEREYPGTNKDMVVVPLKEKVVGDVRPAFLMLLGAVGFVLLIACANVAHMLLARAAARQREIAVRTALGATRARVIRQLLTESLLLALLGGGAGLMLAGWGVRMLVALSPASIPRIDTVALDGRALLFLLVISLVSGIGFGLAPALQVPARDLSNALRDGARGSSEGVRHNRLRSALVASEFALTVMLLVGAGLVLRSFVAMQTIDPGFDPQNVLTMVVSVLGSPDAAPARRALFYQQVLERVRVVPGVQSASAINHLPIAGDIWGYPFAVEGRPRPRPGESPVAAYRVVLPGYFQTMHLPLLQGKDVTESDRVGGPSVVIVNQWLASHYWPGEDPLGKRIVIGDPQDPASALTVVGVVKNAVRHEWTAAPEEEIYVPYLQTREYLEGPGAHVGEMTLVVRTSGDPAALAPAVERAVWALDRAVTISDVQTMERVAREATAQPRFNLLLLSVFAAVALILAAVGIYGVVSYSVARRTNEIGIRIALGASRRDVLGLVVGQSMVVALSGAVVGLVGAAALSRLIAGLLYGVRPSDPGTFVTAALILVGIGLAASYIPARRATRIAPLVALRYE